MRIALISDIHGNLPAFEAVLRDLRKQGADLTVFLGDLVYGGIYPSECVRRLLDIQPLVAIKGNADAWFDVIDGKPNLPPNDHRRVIHRWVNERLTDDERQTIGTFKAGESLVVGDLTLGFYHGSPVSSNDRIYDDDAEEEVVEKFMRVHVDLAAVGNTHVRMEVVRGNTRIINPGAIGVSNDGDTRAGYGILTIEKGADYEQRDIEYPIETYIEELKRSDLPYREMLAEQIATGEPSKSLFRTPRYKTT